MAFLLTPVLFEALAWDVPLGSIVWRLFSKNWSLSYSSVKTTWPYDYYFRLNATAERDKILQAPW